MLDPRKGEKVFELNTYPNSANFGFLQWTSTGNMAGNKNKKVISFIDNPWEGRQNIT